MNVLVDSSVWIEFFRKGKQNDILDMLISENLVCTNNLILTELIPFLKIKKQKQIVSLLSLLPKADLEIDWREIMDFQSKCLEKGLNGFGIPDLIIIQNARQHDLSIFSLDKHFERAQLVIDFKIFNPAQ